MNTKNLLLIAGASALISTQAQAATLVTEDFGTGTSAITSIGTGGGIQSGTSAPARVDDTADIFGASNGSYAHFSNANKHVRSAAYSGAVGAVTTFQFDFYEAEGTIPAPLDGPTYFGLSNDALDLNGGGNRVRLGLDNGSFVFLGTFTDAGASYSLDTAYSISMILNDTGAAVSYSGGNVGAGSADVWIEDFGGGNAQYVGNVLVNNTAGTGYAVAVRSFSSATSQSLFVDNVSLEEGAIAPIPEPSAAALLGLGGISLLIRRRR